METLELTPFYRATVGFDRLFDFVDNSVRSDWPPYDIEKLSNDEYRITMAVAGFTPSEIEVTQDGSSLLVFGQRKTVDEEGQILHRGIGSRSFRQAFSLADHVKVKNATLENGLLEIQLLREVPEQLKPRKITVVDRTSQNSEATAGKEKHAVRAA